MTPIAVSVFVSILAVAAPAQWDPTDPEDVVRQTSGAVSGEAPLGGPDVVSDAGPSGDRPMGGGLSGPRGSSNMQGLLQRRCGSCHGPEKQKGGVRLVPINALFAGDSQDWVVVPGKPDESTLLERIVLPDGHEDIMPPEGEPLSSSEVEQIRSWIAGGNSKEQLVAAAMQGGDEVDPRTWGVVYLSLDLTESQRKEAERMVQDLRQQRSKPGRRGGDRADMDQREREAATRAQRAKSKELRGKIAEAQEQLWEALSPEQQEAMREILGNPAAIAELRRSMRRRNAGRGGQRFPGGPGGSGGRGGDRGAAEG